MFCFKKKGKFEAPKKQGEQEREIKIR